MNANCRSLLVVVCLGLVVSGTAGQTRQPDANISASRLERPAGDALNLHMVGHWGDGPSSAFIAAGQVGYHGRGCIVEAVAIGGRNSAESSLGKVMLPSPVRGFALGSAVVYAVTDGSGLHVIDAYEPTRLVEVGRLDIPGESRAIAVRGDVAAVACGSSGLALVDVGDPTRPRLIAQMPLAGPVMDVAFSGMTVVTGLAIVGLQMVDVTDVDHPIVGPNYPTLGAVWTVEVVGNLLYTGELFGGLGVYKLMGAASPVRIGGYKPDEAWVEQVEVAGSLACAAVWPYGVYLVDVSDPANPSPITLVPVDYDLRDVDLTDGYLYLANGDRGRRSYDVSDPLAPVLVDDALTPGSTSSVDAKDGLVAAVTPGGGLWFLDMSQPALPAVAGVYRPNRDLAGCRFFDALAIIPESSFGYAVLDVSDPGNPVEVGRLATDFSATTVEVRGKNAYVSLGNSCRLGIVDLADPRYPELIGCMPSPDACSAIAVDGDRAYLANAELGLSIVDIRDPANPVHLCDYEIGGSVRDVAVANGFAYVARTESYGIVSVVDVGNPDSPVEVGRLELPDCPNALSIDVEYPFAYVAGHLGGVKTIDITDPRHPLQVGYFQTGHVALDVRCHRGLIYVADGDGGVWALRNELLPTGVADQPASDSRSLRSYPNPCRGVATFSFALTQAGEVQIEIFDLRGHRVARLPAGIRDTGAQQLVWSRRDDAGRPVPAGTYLARLTGVDVVETVKVVVSD